MNEVESMRRKTDVARRAMRQIQKGFDVILYMTDNGPAYKTLSQNSAPQLEVMAELGCLLGVFGQGIKTKDLLNEMSDWSGV